jgi:hypothetical protein
MEWTGLKEWAKLLPRFRKAAEPFADGDGAANMPVAIALDWLLGNKLRIANQPHDAYHEAEFALCLAVEFLRASYRDRDMAAPKRAFALVVGNFLLQDANDLFGAGGKKVRHAE